MCYCQQYSTGLYCNCTRIGECGLQIIIISIVKDLDKQSTYTSQRDEDQTSDKIT